MAEKQVWHGFWLIVGKDNKNFIDYETDRKFEQVRH